MSRTFVCRKADVPTEGMKEFVLPDGLAVLVMNAADGYYACQATCPHQSVKLCEGFYDGSLLTCFQHLWQWDIRTGDPVGAAEKPLQCYPVTVEGDSIYVAPADPSS